jgi:hypothetical protein
MEVTFSGMTSLKNLSSGLKVGTGNGQKYRMVMSEAYLFSFRKKGRLKIKNL